MIIRNAFYIPLGEGTVCLGARARQKGPSGALAALRERLRRLGIGEGGGGAGLGREARSESFGGGGGRSRKAVTCTESAQKGAAGARRADK